MLKRAMMVVLGISLIGLAGCCSGVRKQNTSLQSRLADLQQERDGLISQVDVLKASQKGLEARLAESDRERRRMTELVGELTGEQDKLRQQRQELERLVQDLTGITVERRSEGNFIVMESEILFALGKAELNEDAKASLGRIADYLLDKTGLQIRIDGHTDGVPIRHSPWKDNYHLGAMRAHAVMRYLTDEGLDAERMYIVGFGPNRPVVEPEDPVEPIAENRRVEILLVPDGVRSISEILEGFEE